ncbi:MAG: hypothetical protein U5L04_08860 [Trueperaceae bacterium]|nr:hypothetical protein [Trueperaceae bacterium]
MVRLSGYLIWLVTLLAALFAAFNWRLLSTRSAVNLLGFEVTMPVGLLLLGAVVGVALLFFLLSLLERTRFLRRLTRLEAQLETVQGRLEHKRLTELDDLEKRLAERLNGLGQRIEEVNQVMRDAVREHQKQLENHERDFAGKLEERVLLVRNELAADIGELETELKRAIKERG